MNKFMKEAIKIARKGIKNKDGGPFGCVIVKNDIIIAKDNNKVIKTNDPTKHGEMEVIRKACKKLNTFDLTGCDLYSTGEPCPMCLGAILWANIANVYYGCTIDDAEKIGFRDKKFYNLLKWKPNENFIKQIDRYEVLKLYNEYDKQKTKRY